VLFLTGEVASKSKAQGLDTGADDYVAKPFSGEELLARVRALLRRVRRTEEPSTWLRARDLVMDLGSHTVRMRDQAIKLSPREYELLVMFMRNPGRVLQRRFLLESVWGAGAELKMSSKTVDVTVGRLRAALGDWGKYLETVEAYGYRLNADR
jgi:DNA-binding response OmpR family regulator